MCIAVVGASIFLFIQLSAGVASDSLGTGVGVTLLMLDSSAERIVSTVV